MSKEDRRAKNVREPSLAAVLLLTLAACSSGPAPPDARADDGASADLAITNVTVIDVADGVERSDQTVLIAGSRIVAVGSSGATQPPDDARVIDGRGRYLIPGLWDMHVHSATSTEWHFPLFLAHGITGVRNMHTTVDTALELTQAVKRRLADGSLLGPRFLANGAIVDGPMPVWPNAVRVGTPEAARAAVDSLAGGGADFIKVYQRLSRDAYFALAEHAKQRGIPFVGHVPNAVGASEAADAGQRSIEHVDALGLDCSSLGDSIRAFRRTEPPSSYDDVVRDQSALAGAWSAEHCGQAGEALRRNGTWFVPTLAIYRATAHPDSVLGDTAATTGVPEATLQEWASASRELPAWRRNAEAAVVRGGSATVRAFHDAGVPLLAGTDLGNPFLVPGVSLHDELELLVAAGLSPLEALRTATLEPARFLEATDSLGTIESGKLADLVLLDANPLEDIGNTRRIAGVVANGRYFDRAALDSLLVGTLQRR